MLKWPTPEQIKLGRAVSCTLPETRWQHITDEVKAVADDESLPESTRRLARLELMRRGRGWS
jgi:hypothetical protein